MRTAFAVTLSAVALLQVGGCSASNPNAKGSKVAGRQVKNEGGGSNFAIRYEAARVMTVESERDSALAKVAEDAAEAGDAEVAQKCLREMHVQKVKDDTAYKVALSLAQAGKMDAATEVAKSINAVTRRDEALSKLAKGDFGK